MSRLTANDGYPLFGTAYHHSSSATYVSDDLKITLVNFGEHLC
jgi:hypothetical protein